MGRARGAVSERSVQRIDEASEIEISIRGLTKSFGTQTVLEDISCDIPKGRITLILGPSGTGKSVFLKHVMGLLKPDRGEIWIDGKNLPTLRSRELYEIRRKFGVLFQDGALFGSMDIYDNVAFPLREHTRKSEKEIASIVNEKLHMVGLTGAEKKLPGQISGGMKKRAGLARALVLDPEIVLFDEPDSGLDPVRTAFLNELILDLNRQLNATFIVVTHDIATARRIADYIGMLYLRNLVQFDTKEAMFNSDLAVVRQFLAGATKGPIGMSEEADAGRTGPSAVSSSGLTAEEVERLEREAGAPEETEARAQPDAPQAPSGAGRAAIPPPPPAPEPVAPAAASAPAPPAPPVVELPPSEPAVARPAGEEPAARDVPLTDLLSSRRSEPRPHRPPGPRKHEVDQEADEEHDFLRSMLEGRDA